MRLCRNKNNLNCHVYDYVFYYVLSIDDLHRKTFTNLPVMHFIFFLQDH